MNLLFTTWFDEQNPQRRREYDETLRLNLGGFDTVFVLAEKLDAHKEFPGLWVNWNSRQKFADLLYFAARAKPDDIVVIANSDMVIQSVPLQLIADHIQPNEAYALSRWDIRATDDGETERTHFDRSDSQDVWAFRGPPRANIGGDYFFGVPGVDNKFAHELDAAGYKVLNPSKSIQTFHFHMSGHRPGNTPENRVSPPYLYVSPHRLGERPVYKRTNKASKRASVFRV